MCILCSVCFSLCRLVLGACALCVLCVCLFICTVVYVCAHMHVHDDGTNHESGCIEQPSCSTEGLKARSPSIII